MAGQFYFKRGDTFILEATVNDDITGWNIKSQVRQGTHLVADLIVTVLSATPTSSVYSLFLEDTTDWPVDRLMCDIQYTTDEGQIISTETFTIEVQKDITQ